MSQNFNEKNSDRKAWQEFLNDTSDIFDKDKTEKKKELFRTRYKFDFHGYSIENAKKKLEELILKCFNESVAEILVVTGKGTHSDKKDSVYVSKEHNRLRNTLPDFIKNNSDLYSKVDSIKKAPKELGGEGALIVKLKKLKNKF